MNEDKIIQIIPAPANMLYAFEDGKTYPVACLALVELSNGDREVHAMATINSGPIEDVSDSGQRDELQHLIVPHLPADDRDPFERRLNKHFRL